MRQFDTSEAALKIGFVVSPRDLDLPPKSCVGGLGEHRAAVLFAFGFPDGQFAAGEVDVLDSQTQGFQQSQTRPVEQQGNCPMDPIELAEDAACLVARENHRQPLGTFCPQHALDAVQWLLEHLLI
jgi:hypothetical protein